MGHQDIQKGLRCGYISANITSRFHSLINAFDSDWINRDISDSVFPDIGLLNRCLNIFGDVAEVLSSEQVMRLVSEMTGDHDLNWFFTVDVNLFKKMVINNFQELSLPMHCGKRWAIFSINDALLDDRDRQISLQSNEFNGTHWFTAAIWIT